MKRFALALTTLMIFGGVARSQQSETATQAPSKLANDSGDLIFEDHFDRSEADDSTEDVGNGWSTNSDSRAGGNKQVDLRDETLHIYIHEAADHAVSVRHDVEFRDGVVQCRFMLEHPKDKLTLNFADMSLKSVHAGHLFKVDLTVKNISIQDLKTGVMDLQIRKARKAGETLPAATTELLKTKRKTFPNKLSVGQWHDLIVKISGDTVSVSVDDGKKDFSFQSDGFAHSTKRMLRLSVPRQAIVDDLKIYRVSNATDAASATTE